MYVNDYPHYPKTFGEEIRKYRIDSGFQIRELAEMVGVTEDTIINWEKDRTKPTINNILAIDQLFSL